MAQLSELPLSTCDAVIDAFPKSSNKAIISWQITIGASVSVTVTLKEHRLVLPDTSVAVYSIVVVPKGNVEPEERPVASVCTITAPPPLTNSIFT